MTPIPRWVTIRPYASHPTRDEVGHTPAPEWITKRAPLKPERLLNLRDPQQALRLGIHGVDGGRAGHASVNTPNREPFPASGSDLHRCVRRWQVTRHLAPEHLWRKSSTESQGDPGARSIARIQETLVAMLACIDAAQAPCVRIVAASTRRDLGGE